MHLVIYLSSFILISSKHIEQHNKFSGSLLIILLLLIICNDNNFHKINHRINITHIGGNDTINIKCYRKQKGGAEDPISAMISLIFDVVIKPVGQIVDIFKMLIDLQKCKYYFLTHYFHCL